ncbi:hypothetical protein GUITHDRAFT_141862 [Guillardia theta CCMP2712]|uniref:Uncharacterized protein n=1 Tax=Guillardia theta (strain CCMP2712) TaxID=905079 RepID=L1J0I3_GUITC|nr:hypothetical protein GUITHDRAFT_141862 [Guillardia theta CCMP2712]EKX41605.1 hypothetical protein GUITHDRAFT_141862 [Guillardia theta CCMP2712]|eukprot:XP_005828585.1 hypothetical protein GUITHDRAFT_141862 [Guillardia theta CCMP2712]
MAGWMPGLEGRIAGDKMSLSDCEEICQVLQSFGEDSYTDEKTFSWSGTVVSEFVRATKNAAAKRRGEDWHRLAEDGRSSRNKAGGDTGPSPLQVVHAKWLHHTISQSCPTPLSKNIVTIAFSSNVPLGPARAGGSKESLCWLQVSGLHMFAPSDTEDPLLDLGGSIAKLFANSPDSEQGGKGSWNDRGDLLLYLRGVLSPRKKHFLELHVRNPAMPFAMDRVSLEAVGCVEIDPVYLTDINSSHSEVSNDRMTQSAEEAFFIYAGIHSDTNYPGSLNTITVSFSLNRRIMQGARVVVSGLRGSASEDDGQLEITFPGEKEKAAPFANTGVWSKGDGTLEVQVEEELAPGNRSSFSFKLQNPARSQPLSPPFISIVGSDTAVPAVELKFQESPGDLVSAQGSEAIEPTDAVVRNARYDWYETFEAHLRLQYPDLYANKQEETLDLREKFVRMEPSLRVGISQPYTVTCMRSSGSAISVSWQPFFSGKALTSESPTPREQSVFFVQVSEADAHGNPVSFRTVFAGPSTSCTIPAAFCPPVSRKTCVRVREECLDDQGRLVSSSWNYADLREEAEGGEEPRSIDDLSSFLSWSPSRSHPSMTIGHGGKSVRNASNQRWIGALGAKKIQGSVRWRFSFSGRVERLAVGIAMEDIPVDELPRASKEWKQRTRTHCIAWLSWDGSILCRGEVRAPTLSRHVDMEFAMCIEGDSIEVWVDCERGQVEIRKDKEVLLRETSNDIFGCGVPWFPYACSDCPCTIFLEEVVDSK